MNLSGKHVVVTGAGGGLGGAVVDAFRNAGATCHTPSRKDGVDLTNEKSVQAYYQQRPPLWASVHLAGGYAGGPFVETSLEKLQQQLQINLVTAFLCCREAAKNIGNRGGRLVNVTSRAALVPGPKTSAYGASKAAVNFLTQALAKELEPSGVLVNAVAPSVIDTPTNRAAMPKADQAAWPKPAEIAQAILWLASPENTLTSGAIIPVYGKA